MRTLLLTVAAAGVLVAPGADAGVLGLGSGRKAETAVVSQGLLDNIQQALDEQRLIDAGRMLDQALLAGARDPRLTILGGDLNLARAQYEQALTAYRTVETAPAVNARSLQGQGLALSMLGHSDDALAVLQKAVAADATLWRAWNALGVEYDKRGRWQESEAAYAKALASSGEDALALNNRGYSRLLQHRRDEAVADLVAALQKRPAFEEARTNLRLALALGGEYERSIAGGSPQDQAALLNNAGFAAGLRGDYAQAETLLDRAMAVKSEYYARASENLKIVRALAARGATGEATRVLP